MAEQEVVKRLEILKQQQRRIDEVIQSSNGVIICYECFDTDTAYPSGLRCGFCLADFDKVCGEAMDEWDGITKENI